MKKLFIIGSVTLLLAGCANATRTFYLPTFEERTISGERVANHAPLVVPPDYRNPKLPEPKYGEVQSIPLPPPRPKNLNSPKN